jgi:pilus assembly protein CpaB
VIAAGATTLVSSADENGDQVNEALLTVAVDQEDAQKIVYAQGHGKITFGLLNDKSEVDKNESGTSAQNLFD